MSARADLDERYPGHGRWTEKGYVIGWGGHLKLPPLTDAQVAVGARPGEGWEAARERLERARYPAPPLLDCRECCGSCGTFEEAELQLCFHCYVALEAEVRGTFYSHPRNLDGEPCDLL